MTRDVFFTVSYGGERLVDESALDDSSSHLLMSADRSSHRAFMNSSHHV